LPKQCSPRKRGHGGVGGRCHVLLIFGSKGEREQCAHTYTHTHTHTHTHTLLLHRPFLARSAHTHAHPQFHLFLLIGNKGLIRRARLDVGAPCLGLPPGIAQHCCDAFACSRVSPAKCSLSGAAEMCARMCSTHFTSRNKLNNKGFISTPFPLVRQRSSLDAPCRTRRKGPVGACQDSPP